MCVKTEPNPHMANRSHSPLAAAEIILNKNYFTIFVGFFSNDPGCSSSNVPSDKFVFFLSFLSFEHPN